MPKGPQAFPKAVRLRHRTEFLKVQSRGRKVTPPQADLLLGLWLPNGLSNSRLGVTVSSKVGNAVVRGRIRRCLREAFRKNRSRLPQGVDLVLIARSGAAVANCKSLGDAFMSVADAVTQKVGPA